uniref:Uncharacterized protein n=1 Tax=Rhizophagus irregularis (strain DAOM 181602 / DAOM 197198 / MUCL 43194) TaxID=747089 RepID=U9TD00_RHIID
MFVTKILYSRRRQTKILRRHLIYEWTHRLNFCATFIFLLHLKVVAVHNFHLLWNSQLEDAL